MAVSTWIKNTINKGLNCVGLEIGTLTSRRHELRRLQALRDSGYFDAPAFPVPKSFADVSPEPIFADLAKYSSRIDDLADPARNGVGFSFDNSFFTSPDAEVLYCMVRRHRPKRIVEIGSGHSTRIIRMALEDGNIDARLTSIDPNPRVDIDSLADTAIRDGVETVDDFAVFTELAANDVLFIDSSHELRAGNDMTHIYLRVLPLVATGVFVHIHDIFLPYDYRESWLIKEKVAFSEQYLVQVMLQSEANLEVIWPGYYLQRTVADFAERFPHMGSRDAQSLWLRKGRCV